jgi:hypothetical protein
MTSLQKLTRQKYTGTRITVGTQFIASVNSLRRIVCTDPGKISRVSWQMDGCAWVQWRTIPLNKLTDAINWVPTVIRVIVVR